jgi:uncharacterized C2H2 Zn-finger protein
MVVHECGRCGGVYREADLDRHARNAHDVEPREIEFEPVEGTDL